VKRHFRTHNAFASVKATDKTNGHMTHKSNQI